MTFKFDDTGGLVGEIGVCGVYNVYIMGIPHKIENITNYSNSCAIIMLCFVKSHILPTTPVASSYWNNFTQKIGKIMSSPPKQADTDICNPDLAR